MSHIHVTYIASACFYVTSSANLERFQYLLLKTKAILKNEYRFLAESTKIENATFPYKTAMSEASVKANSVEIFGQKGVLRSFTKFTGKHLHQCLFFNKVAGTRLRHY